jgi:hypothetical protein
MPMVTDAWRAQKKRSSGRRFPDGVRTTGSSPYDDSPALSGVS